MPNNFKINQEEIQTKVIHTYIHTYTQKRNRDRRKKSDRKNISIYDLDKYEILEDIARREGTNVSSIINNLYEDFIKKLDSPQKTLELFESEIVLPTIDASPETWKIFYQSLNIEQYKKLDTKIQTLLFIHNQRWKEL